MDSPQAQRRIASACRRSPILSEGPCQAARNLKIGLALITLLAFGACRNKAASAPTAPSPAEAASPAAMQRSAPATPVMVAPQPFNFQISSGADQYQIEGF